MKELSVQRDRAAMPTQSPETVHSTVRERRVPAAPAGWTPRPLPCFREECLDSGSAQVPALRPGYRAKNRRTHATQ